VSCLNALCKWSLEVPNQWFFWKCRDLKSLRAMWKRTLLDRLLCSDCSARQIIARGRSEFRTEWKLALEATLIDFRSGNYDKAIREVSITMMMNVTYVQAEQAIRMHPGTGRLWAILINLKQARCVVSLSQSFVCSLRDLMHRNDCSKRQRWRLPSQEKCGVRVLAFE
jgi:hypothetical protein